MPLHPDLVEITPATHHVSISLEYATSNNITGTPIYQTKGCFLHKEAAEKLKKATVIARSLNFGILIYDAFRPLDAQQVLWDYVQDANYISHPQEGSVPHCRGVAIDLTLTDASGLPLDMGTNFDFMDISSHHSHIEGLTQTALLNRKLLLGIMTTAGWDYFDNEWWHYQLHHARNYQKFSDQEAGTGLMS